VFRWTVEGTGDGGVGFHYDLANRLVTRRSDHSRKRTERNRGWGRRVIFAQIHIPQDTSWPVMHSRKRSQVNVVVSARGVAGRVPLVGREPPAFPRDDRKARLAKTGVDQKARRADEVQARSEPFPENFADTRTSIGPSPFWKV